MENTHDNTDIMVNFSVKKINNDTVKLLSDNSDIIITRIDEILGKSGDNVYIINLKDDKSAKNKMCVIKIFNSPEKKDKNMDEINHQTDFSKIFQDHIPGYNPFPRVYYKGILYGIHPFKANDKKTHARLYMIMQLYHGITLTRYISSICGTKNNYPLPIAYQNITIDNIIIQLFYIISKMQMNHMSHCDLHGENIFIIPTNQNVEFKFTHLDDTVHRNWKSSGYLIKLLDLGKGTFERCIRSKSLLYGLRITKNVCKSDNVRVNNNSQYHKKSNLWIDDPLMRGNSDLNYFINTLESLLRSPNYFPTWVIQNNPTALLNTLRSISIKVDDNPESLQSGLFEMYEQFEHICMSFSNQKGGNMELAQYMQLYVNNKNSYLSVSNKPFKLN